MAYAFDKKKTILDSNQYIHNLKNKKQTYNHLLTNTKINNNNYKHNHIHTINNIVFIKNIHSLEKDYTNIINNYDTLSNKLSINNSDLTDIINNINSINYKITLNEEKLNIYIKKLNISNKLNNEYQDDILELENTNQHNKQQLLLLENYYTSEIKKLNLNIENLTINYEETLEKNKQLELEKLILKENKEKLILEDELTNNELEIMKKKLEKEKTNNNYLDEEIDFYEAEIIKYKQKLEEKTKQIQIYDNEKIQTTENIHILQQKIHTTSTDLETIDKVVIEQKKIIELNNLQLQESEEKHKKILEHSQNLDIEYKQSIEELNYQLQEAKTIATTSKQELNYLLQNHELIEEKYLKNKQELDSYKKRYEELNKDIEQLNKTNNYLTNELEKKIILKEQLDNTIRQFTLIEIEKTDIEKKLTIEIDKNETLMIEIDQLKKKEEVLLKLIETNEKELTDIKNAYNKIIHSKNNETTKLTNQLDNTLTKLSNIQKEFDLQNNLYETTKKDYTHLKDTYNDTFKSYIKENKELSNKMDEINIENIKLKILTNQLKNISYVHTQNETDATNVEFITNIYKNLKEIVERFIIKFGTNSLVAFKEDYHHSDVHQFLGLIFDIINELANNVKIHIQDPEEIETTPITEEETDNESKFTGIYFTLGSQSTRPMFKFHYDALKLLKPEWRYYLQAYGIPKWPENNESDENKNKIKRMKARIYHRIVNIKNMIGTLDDDLPKFFYEMGDEEFTDESETPVGHGIRKVDHNLKHEFTSTESPPK
jgi:hypothetical protein